MKQTLILFFAICMALGVQAQTVIGASPYIVPASGSYTIPAGVSSIMVQCWGGGGGGTRFYRAGGGGGTYAMSNLTVTPGSIHNITVGAPGAGDYSSYSTDGGTSSFDASVAAVGGSSGDNGAGGGVSYFSTGSIKYSGGYGYYGGGGSAGTGSDGNNATHANGAAPVAGGGAGGNYGNSYGSNGGYPGGGGGGSNINPGGNGGAGLVIITYTITRIACTPSVSISANNTNLDSRTSIVLTATPTNGGNRPSYNWYKNGVLVAGIHGNVLSYGGALGNGDSINATITTTTTIHCGADSSLAGQTATSNTVTFTKSGSSANDITTLTMPNQVGSSVINTAAATVSATVTTPPAGRTAIHPTRLFITPGATYGPSYVVNRDFSHPVTYTVVAQNGSTKVWTVTVLDQSGNKTSGTADALNAVSEMTIYPNPATTYINVIAAGGTDVPVITIVDLEGRVMYHQALPVTETIDHQIDLSGFAAGTYLVHVAVGGKLQTRQFVVSQ